ncbi:MAG: ABC transporter permease [Thermodesulfobacteriota bacterium]
MFTVPVFPEISLRFGHVWRRNFDVWRKYYKASLVGNLGEPFLYLIALGFGVGRFIQEIEGVSYLQFIAPGLVAASAMNSASFECTFGSFTRMTVQKTFHAVVATPISMEEVVVGDIFWGASKSLLSGTVILLAVFAIGLISSPFFLLIIPLIFLVGIMFASLAMIITAIAPSYDFFSYFFTLAVSPMFLFSGIFFPLNDLPEWAQALAWMLPLTHVVNIFRSLAFGTISLSIFFDLLWICVFTWVVFCFSVKKVKDRLIV